MTTPIKVLLLEDHHVTLNGLRYGLAEEHDIEIVATAMNSDEGFAMAQKFKPDVILLDLHLPGSLGPKSMVEKFCALTECKVIIFSSEKRVAFVETILELGVAAYLLKSETSARVAEAIRQTAGLGGDSSMIVSTELGEAKVILTRTEQDLVRMLAHGMKYQEISERRFTVPSTVRKQCDLLVEKLNLANREELIAWAVDNGYGSLETVS